MSVKIGELFVDVKANIGSFISDMDTAQAKGAAFGSAIGVAVGSIATNAFAVLGQKIIQTINVFPELTKAAIDFGESLSLQSEKTGIGVERLSEYAYAAKLTNTSTEQLTTTIARFSKQVEIAAEGGAGAAKAVDALGKVGIKVTDLALPMDQLFQKMAAGFSNMGAGQEKTATGMQLMGRAAFEMTPTLNKIGNSMNDVAAGAQKAGVVMTEEMSQGARDAAESAKNLGESWDGLKLSLGESLIPVMEKFTATLQKIADFVNNNPIDWNGFFGGGLAGASAGGLLGLMLGGPIGAAGGAALGGGLGAAGGALLTPKLGTMALAVEKSLGIPLIAPAPVPPSIKPPDIAYTPHGDSASSITKEVETLSKEMEKYAIKIPVEFAQLPAAQIAAFEGQLSGIQTALKKATDDAQVKLLTASFEQLQRSVTEFAAFNKLLNPLSDLTAKMKDLEAVHVSDTLLVKVYGDELIKLGAAGGTAAGQLTGHAEALLNLAIARQKDRDEMLLTMRSQGARSLQIQAESEGLTTLIKQMGDYQSALAFTTSLQDTNAAHQKALSFLPGTILNPDPIEAFTKMQAQISTAFSAFGSTSGFDLAGLAKSAQDNFAIVTASGQASARTLLTDWIKTQQAIRDAAQAGAAGFAWSPEQSKALVDAEVKLAKMPTDEQNATSQMKLFHEEIKNAMTSLNTGLANSIVSGKGFVGVLQSVTDELEKWAIKFLVLIPLENQFMNAFTSNTSASGGIFGLISSLFGGGGSSFANPLSMAAGLASGTVTPNVPFLPSPISSVLTGFASGGPVAPDIPIMVGERGPEMFMPSSAGTVVPNDKLGGGRASVSIVNNNDFRGADPSSEARLIAALNAVHQQSVRDAVAAIQEGNYRRP